MIKYFAIEKSEAIKYVREYILRGNLIRQHVRDIMFDQAKLNEIREFGKNIKVTDEQTNKFIAILEDRVFKFKTALKEYIANHNEDEEVQMREKLQIYCNADLQTILEYIKDDKPKIMEFFQVDESSAEELLTNINELLTW